MNVNMVRIFDQDLRQDLNHILIRIYYSDYDLDWNSNQDFDQKLESVIKIRQGQEFFYFGQEGNSSSQGA